MLTLYPVHQIFDIRKPLSTTRFLCVHDEMVPRIGHMAIRNIQPSWNAETPTEQGRGSQRRSGATEFEEARVERWCARERYHEFAGFVISPALLSFT